MTTIRQEDFIASVADALQFISYYHPQDYIDALGAAYRAEESPAALRLRTAKRCIRSGVRCSAVKLKPVVSPTDFPSQKT